MRVPVLLISSISFMHGLVNCKLLGGYNLDSYGNNNETDILEYVLLEDKDPCMRTCVKGAPPMRCRYKFQLEWYQTMSKACYDCPLVKEDCSRPHCIPGDGYKRSILAVNRKIPGPNIQVCLGDEVVVDVENHLGSDTTTIHWHGQLQKGTPYMDGVPFVTQCPIVPGTSFRYHFRVMESGTHFWHSHAGFQRGDGAFGAFIVKIPDEDNPLVDQYDFDLPSHTILVIDWGQVTGSDKFLAHHHSDGDNKPTSILVNGLGRFAKFNNSDNATLYVPPPEFHVKKGFRYRFRTINAGFLNCPIEISVDNHTLNVISTDGVDIKPIRAESLVTYAGERFDFVINANQSVGSYLIRFRGQMDCSERFNSVHAFAILKYDHAAEIDYNLLRPSYAESHKNGLQINPVNIGTEGNSSLYVPAPAMRSLFKMKETSKEVADFQYYIAYDFYRINNPHFHKSPFYGFTNVTNPKKQLLTPQLNHITMKYPQFPPLTQRDQINEENMFCNETTMNKCDPEFCECTHVVRIGLGSLVELILIDEGFAFDANHPFHLHGYSFRVVAMERLGRNTTLGEVLEKDKKGEIKRNLKDAPIKDTVTVPDGGYTVVRFHATSPGYWLFHCHIEFHSDVGMAILFKVGEHDQMSRVPKNFPKCGNYLPDPAEDMIDCDSGTLNATQYKFYCSSSTSLIIMHHSSFIIILLIVARLIAYVS